MARVGCGLRPARPRKRRLFRVRLTAPHRAWTKQARPQADHSFCVDDTSLTAAALREGLGVGYLPCFMGDSDPTLVRFREPEKQHELGLWFLYHRDLRNTKRVILFRQFMQSRIENIRSLFEG
jgi:DNA-binding transcriptional LysR family regulator